MGFQTSFHIIFSLSGEGLLLLALSIFTSQWDFQEYAWEKKSHFPTQKVMEKQDFKWETVCVTPILEK